MRFVSLCSGIGGFELGFGQAGMECVLQVEKDPQAAAVLEHRFPGVRRLLDVEDKETERACQELRPDGVVAGFPCQDLSLAGRRAGLAGNRSGLFWSIARIIAATAPRWFVLENVPGLLSSNQGRDMGTLIRHMGECGYGLAWRVLDLQWFRIPQRRRRVFIVGCLGASASRSAEILFEPHIVPRRASPREETKTKSSRALVDRNEGRGIANALTCHHGRYDASDNLICHTLNAAHSVTEDGRGRGLPIVAQTLMGEGSDAPSDGRGGGTPLIPVDLTQLTHPENRSRPLPGDPCHTLANSSHPPVIFQGPRPQKWGPGKPSSGWAVRKLMPIECERLQGFPDNWTKWGPGKTRPISDSARYRMIGNAVAVPHAAWIGRRIAEVLS